MTDRPTHPAAFSPPSWPPPRLKAQMHLVTDKRGEVLFYRFVADGRAGFVAPADAPIAVMDGGWMEIEQTWGGPWPEYRAVRPVRPLRAI